MANPTSSTHHSEKRRVVVTGMGIASAIGMDVDSVWNNLIAGNSGIDHFQSFDASNYKVRIGAEIPNEPIAEKLSRLKRRPIDRTIDMAMVASHDALIQAGLIQGEPPYEEQSVAVIIGTGEGTATSHQAVVEVFLEKGPSAIRPTAVPRCMYNAISAGLSLQFRLNGPNYIIVSACTSATNAIGSAYRMIRDGYEEVALTGGTDGFFTPFFYGVWNNIPALSKIEDPKKACRPFAADRDGTILGEGAGALVLETYEGAKSRGATILGEILGYGDSSDALHITSPREEGQVKAINRALNDAGVKPEDLSMINSHGTATISNDACESKSIRSILGDATDDIPVVANKSFFGHTLGASGALETITTLLSLQKRMAPPNLNLENQDPECAINLTGSEPVSIKPGPAMKNSFGFGGGNGVLILDTIE
jgi:3-oxoacyl-[acyl-carrier-protein] synthase II